MFPRPRARCLGPTDLGAPTGPCGGRRQLELGHPEATEASGPARHDKKHDVSPSSFCRVPLTSPPASPCHEVWADAGRVDLHVRSEQAARRRDRGERARVCTGYVGPRNATRPSRGRGPVTRCGTGDPQGRLLSEKPQACRDTEGRRPRRRRPYEDWTRRCDARGTVFLRRQCRHRHSPAR